MGAARQRQQFRVLSTPDQKKALRKVLFRYKLHADDELFEKAYSYNRRHR